MSQHRTRVSASSRCLRVRLRQVLSALFCLFYGKSALVGSSFPLNEKEHGEYMVITLEHRRISSFLDDWISINIFKPWFVPIFFVDFWRRGERRTNHGPRKKKKWCTDRWFWPSTTIQLIALAIDRLETALFLSTQCLHYIEEQGSFALISSYWCFYSRYCAFIKHQSFVLILKNAPPLQSIKYFTHQLVDWFFLRRYRMVILMKKTKITLTE